jgi:hypothetical protein
VHETLEPVQRPGRHLIDHQEPHQQILVAFPRLLGHAGAS